MTHTLEIPDFLPTSLNVLLALHWSRRNRRKQGDADVIGHYFRESGIPPAIGKRRVSVKLVLAGRAKAGDHDNRLKSLLDGLRDCRAIVDDKPTLCEVGGFTAERGPRRMTLVELEDMEA